jgi:hypothetical protein
VKSLSFGIMSYVFTSPPLVLEEIKEIKKMWELEKA